jgi:micrococcal nuclease
MITLLQSLLERKELFGVPFLNYVALLLIAVFAVVFVLWFLKISWLMLRALVYGHLVTVTAVVDGDTFKGKPFLINRRKKKAITVRIIGIDTPESVKSPNKEIAPHGKESSDFAKSRLKTGKWLILLNDVDTIDQYGRELCYVYTIWGEFFNATLLKKGMAFAYKYPPNVRFAELFDKLQDEARAKGRGLWKIYSERNTLTANYKKSADFKKFIDKHGKPSQLK